MSRLLVVEDDLSLGETLVERLRLNSYEVFWAKNIVDAKKLVHEKAFDLLLLDVGLPDGSGFDLARDIKGQISTPFIFMTAQSDAPERLRGFEMGAEEYIPKPFHLKEILIRIKHVLQTHETKKNLKVGNQIIDFQKMAIVASDGKVEYLSPKDFQLLDMLIHASPKVVSRDDIIETIWGLEKFPSNRTVDNVIVRLRNLLGDKGEVIRSVRGIGYQWVGEKKSHE